MKSEMNPRRGFILDHFKWKQYNITKGADEERKKERDSLHPARDLGKET